MADAESHFLNDLFGDGLDTDAVLSSAGGIGSASTNHGESNPGLNDFDMPDSLDANMASGLHWEGDALASAVGHSPAISSMMQSATRPTPIATSGAPPTSAQPTGRQGKGPGSRGGGGRRKSAKDKAAAATRADEARTSAGQPAPDVNVNAENRNTALSLTLQNQALLADPTLAMRMGTPGMQGFNLSSGMGHVGVLPTMTHEQQQQQQQNHTTTQRQGQMAQQMPPQSQQQMPQQIHPMYPTPAMPQSQGSGHFDTFSQQTPQQHMQMAAAQQIAQFSPAQMQVHMMQQLQAHMQHQQGQSQMQQQQQHPQGHSLHSVVTPQQQAQQAPQQQQQHQHQHQQQQQQQHYLVPRQQNLQQHQQPAAQAAGVVPHGLVQPASLQAVCGRLQSCQTKVVEAMQRFQTLSQSISQLCPSETAQQLLLQVPNVQVEQARQLLLQAQQELAMLAMSSSPGAASTGSQVTQHLQTGPSPALPWTAQAQALQQQQQQQQLLLQQQQQQQQQIQQDHRASSVTPALPAVPVQYSPQMQAPSFPDMTGQSSVQAGQQAGQMSMGTNGHAQGAQQPGQGQQQQGTPLLPQEKAQQGGSAVTKREAGSGSPKSTEDEIVIVGCSGNFGADLPHARAHCVNRPHRVVKERVGTEGDNNAQYCPNCFCYVCDVRASQCQGWLLVGHCHAHDKDPYWRALREFTRIEMLSSSPLLPALACDEAAQMEAHRWCVNGLLAFHRYRDGDLGADGVYNHSFQHVTDVASSAMKAIVGHLSGPKGPRTTLALLDGITSSIVVNTWRPMCLQDAKHKWCQGTYAAYKAIIEQLEKYWVLSIVHTSTRSVPPLALAIMAHRLKRLSKLATREVAGGTPQMSHVPLTHAVAACERGWTHPVVVSILEGACHDNSQREAQTLQRARLHVLERAGRWKEAYNYATFHGHIAKSLVYMVRAGRHAEVLPTVFSHSETLRGGKCMPVCEELTRFNQTNVAIRLAMYCAFGDYEQDSGDREQLAQNRMPYVQWLIEQCSAQLTPEEKALRRQPGQPSVLAARRDAEEWARSVADALPGALRNPLPDCPVGAQYSDAICMMERLANLCAITNPMLGLNCAKVLSRQGDYFGAASVVLAMGNKSNHEDEGLGVDEASTRVVWALHELAPELGMECFQPILASLKPEKMSPQMQMSMASALLHANEVVQALKWATSASLVGAPSAENILFANFEEPRQFRSWDLQAFIDAAEKAQDTQSALVLCELQMWWEPSWQNLQALKKFCSQQKFDLRRQQLQSLALNDASCSPEMRFDVLVREGMHVEATGILISAARERPQPTFEALRKALEGLGSEIVKQAAQQSNGLIQSLMPWLETTVPSNEGIDTVTELLARWIPQRILPLYDKEVEAVKTNILGNSVNAGAKNQLRSWLLRTRRMYQASGQADGWDKCFAELTQTLKRKSSLSSVWAELGASAAASASAGSSALVSTPLPQTPSQAEGQSIGDVSSQAGGDLSTPAVGVSLPGSPI